MAFDPLKTLEDLDLEVEWIGIREVEEETSYNSVRDGHPDENSHRATHGIMIEVLAGGRFAYACTNRLEPNEIRAAAENALARARSAMGPAPAEFTAAVRPPARGHYQSPSVADLEDLTPGRLYDLLNNISETLRISDAVISTSAAALLTHSRTRFVSTNGADLEQEFSYVSTDFGAVAREGEIIQRRTDGGVFAHSYQGGADLLEEARLLERARLTAREALELLSAEECPSETMDLVLAPDQMMLQIHESIGHPLELDRILGDERNYAGWSFVREKDFGKLQYGSELMNVTFDPHVAGQYASYAFDDGGMPAERVYLIREGLLERGLGAAESHARSGIPGTANFRATSWNRAPIDRMANLNLEPGNSSFDDIIASVERGVFMRSNRSWSIDDYRNKFQFGCEYGQLIENGRLTRTVRNPNYRGVTTPFWNNLRMVGDASTFGVFGVPMCGKGEPNQIMRVGHASPVCLFGDIEVFGGA